MRAGKGFCGMDDLVHRLRLQAAGGYGEKRTLMQAADEIERLRSVLQSAFEDMRDNDDSGAFMTLKHECAPITD